MLSGLKYARPLITTSTSGIVLFSSLQTFVSNRKPRPAPILFFFGRARIKKQTISQKKEKYQKKEVPPCRRPLRIPDSCPRFPSPISVFFLDSGSGPGLSRERAKAGFDPRLSAGSSSSTLGLEPVRLASGCRTSSALNHDASLNPVWSRDPGIPG